MKHATKMSSRGLLEAKITSNLRTTGNYYDDCGFCGGRDGTLVGGGSGCGDDGSLSNGAGFQKSYDDLTA